ncbi:MAG: aminomethyltransferase family protein, partial [Nitrospira sp.]|nr:aminomethyltransferase family protein [Nitrospira sp.]
MKRLSLQDQHLQLGASFEEVAGWEVPAHYGDAKAEYQAVRQSAGLADLSYRGKVRITGDDRIKWLQSIVSNDILPLQPGQGCYSSLLNHKGKMLTYFRLYVQADSVMIEDVGEIGEVTYQTLRKFLLYGTKAKMEHCTESWGLLLVSGPQAPTIVQSAFDVDVADLKPVTFVTVRVGTQTALAMRTEETGEIDLEVMLPVDALPAAWNRLWEAGRPYGITPVGRQALDTLRIEAGLPKAGVDLTEEIVPPEANLENKAYSLNKGCYPGQEVMARLDTYGQVRRRMVGLVLQDQHVPAKGAKLFSGDREVGWVTSATVSPQLNRVIALGFP